MSTWKTFLIGSVAILLAAAVIGAAYITNRPAERKPPENLAMLVDTIPVSADNVVFQVNSQGLVEPRTETALVSEVGGKVESISEKLVAGGFFREGEILLTIDQSDYETAARRAEANLASRRAQLSQAQAQTEQARRDWEKLHPGEGEPNDLVLRLPQLEDARANIRAAEADLAKARRDLERTRIRAPYEGIVKEKRVDLGQFVSPGTPVALIAGVDIAEIRLPVSDSELAYLPLPQGSQADTGLSIPVTLRAVAGGEQQVWQADIVRTEGIIDRSTRQIYTVARFEDPYRLQPDSEGPPLRFGTFVDATIQGIEASDVKALPRYTLRPNGTVLIASDENKLEVRPVRVSRSTPETVYISEGLLPGDRVITTAIEAPIPGTAIMSREDEELRVARQRVDIDEPDAGENTETGSDFNTGNETEPEVAEISATDSSQPGQPETSEQADDEAGLMENLSGRDSGSEAETELAASRKEDATDASDSGDDGSPGESLDDLKRDSQDSSGGRG